MEILCFLIYAYTGSVILFMNITVVSYSIFKYNMKCKCSDTLLTKLGWYV